MKNYLIFIILILSFGQASSQIKEAINAQYIDGTSISSKQAELIFEKAKILPNQTQISIALINQGEVNYYGVRRENDSIFAAKNHQKVFEIGSISKVFTSTLLAGLVIDKKIKLDDPIQKYLDFPLKEKTPITFKQLANHTSGLPRLPTILDSDDVDMTNPYVDFGEAELKHYLKKELTLTQNPGEKSVYSNLGGGLLGYVLSEIEETNYEALIQQRTFAKYEMRNSTTKREKISGELVKGLNEAGEETLNWDMSILMGAGGILSTVEDLGKFGIAHFDSTNQELELTKTKNFKIDDVVELGLGWAMIHMKSGAEWLWHNGGTGGYTSSMILNPETKNGIIVLSNVSGLSKDSGNVGAIASGLMDILEEEK